MDTLNLRCRESLLFLLTHVRSHPHIFYPKAKSLPLQSPKVFQDHVKSPLLNTLTLNCSASQYGLTSTADARMAIRNGPSRPDFHHDPNIKYPTGEIHLSSTSGNSLQRLQFMVSSGLPPQVSEANSLLTDCASRSSWVDVWKCLQSLRNLGVKIEEQTYGTLWEAALKASFINDSVSLFRSLIACKGYICQRSYTTAISRLLKVKKKGMPNKFLAYELWKELEASTQSLDAASLRAGMNACVEFGRLEEALQLMEKMKKSNQRPGHGAFNIIIKHYCNAGKMDSALKTFKEMRLYTPPDIITFNTLVHGFATQGNIVKARAIIDKAKYEGLTLDVMTYSPYLLALAREGAAREARSVIEEMWGAGLPPNAWCYAALVEAHARADGDMMRAEAAAEEMESRAGLPPSTVVFNLLIQGHLKRGEVGKAKVTELLKKMTDLGVLLGVDTYCLLMNSAAESGEEGAVKHVQGLLRSVRARGLAPDAVQASTLSKVLVRQGQAKEALQAASECNLIDNDFVILNQMVHLYSSNGQMTEAEQAAARAAAAAASSGRSPPVEAYGALIRGYYRLKDLPPLVIAFRSFLRMGGKPNRKMANAVVRLSLLEGQLNIALQAIRVMKLLDVDMDTEQYRSWVMQFQRRQQSTQQRSTGSDSFSSSRQAVGGGRGLSPESMMRDSLSSTRGRFAQIPRKQGPPLINMSMPSSESSAKDFQGYQDSHDSSSAGSTGDGLERLKWFLGLPNNYYESSWK